MVKRGFDFLVFLLAIVFISISISSLSFTVQDNCVPTKTVMRLSNDTNAHGELWDQINYNTYLCSTDEGSHSCEDDMANKVIGLSNYTNAHGEIPEINNGYLGNNVCFENLRCENFSGSCPLTHTLEMVSLSGNTNAHIGNFSNYDTKICCSEVLASDLYWTKQDGTRTDSLPTVVPGTTRVKLVFRNAGISAGEKIEFQVEKKRVILLVTTWPDVGDSFDSEGSIPDSDAAKKLWTIPAGIGDEGDTITLRFKGTHPVSGDVNISEELDITIATSEQINCNNFLLCSHYDASNCADDPCDVIEDNLDGIVDCSPSEIDCFCSYTSPNCLATSTNSSVVGGVTNIDETCIINITKKDTDGCADGKIEFEWDKICDGSTPDSDGKSGYACPAEIQLPFFGFYNFVATTLIIALIYYFMFSNHKKKRKKFLDRFIK